MIHNIWVYQYAEYLVGTGCYTCFHVGGFLSYILLVISYGIMDYQWIEVEHEFYFWKLLIRYMTVKQMKWCAETCLNGSLFKIYFKKSTFLISLLHSTSYVAPLQTGLVFVNSHMYHIPSYPPSKTSVFSRTNLTLHFCNPLKTSLSILGLGSEENVCYSKFNGSNHISQLSLTQKELYPI